MTEKSVARSYEDLQVKFIKLSKRERSLAILAGICLILLGGFVFFVEPVMLNLDKQNIQNERRQTESDRLGQTMLDLSAELSKDPNVHLKARLGRVKQQIVEADQTFAAQITDLVPAAKMPLLLENVFAQFASLKLIEMQSIAPTKLLKPGEEKNQQSSDKSPESNLYQHGVKLVLEGRYFDIQRYLERVESLPWQFYWKKFSYKVKEYPTAEVVIEIYTVSTTTAFIGVRNDS